MRKNECEICRGLPTRYAAIRASSIIQIAPDEIEEQEIPVYFCPVCGREIKAKVEKKALEKEEKNV